MSSKSNERLQRLCLSGVFSAATAVFIVLFHIPYGNVGYIHLGDAIIYLCACFLPTPYAALSGAIGGAIADLVSGYPLYAVPTFIIKALLTLAFTSQSKKILCKRNVVAVFVSGMISIALYAVSDFALSILVSGMPFGGAMAAVGASALNNLIQAIASGTVFVIFAALMKRSPLK